jgi:hypothetical protein
MADLHARILAEIEEREQVARIASAGPWHLGFDEEAGMAIRDADEDVIAFAYVPADDQHIALHNPADALRRYAHYRRILERHQPCKDLNVWEHGESYPACTHGFDDEDDITDAIWWHRCSEIRDLAEALNVTLEDGDA